MFKEIEIDLRTVNDIDLVIDVLKNTHVIGEMFSNYIDEEFLTAVIYADDESYDELLNKFSVFENIFGEEMDLDEECIDNMTNTKKSLIDDLYELRDIIDRYEKFYERYKI